MADLLLRLIEPFFAELYGSFGVRRLPVQVSRAALQMLLDGNEVALRENHNSDRTGLYVRAGCLLSFETST